MTYCILWFYQDVYISCTIICHGQYQYMSVGNVMSDMITVQIQVQMLCVWLLPW